MKYIKLIVVIMIIIIFLSIQVLLFLCMQKEIKVLQEETEINELKEYIEILEINWVDTLKERDMLKEKFIY